jgi:hypothetical protein
MARLRVTGFGVRGVNAVDSPLHVRDDELTWGQNLEVRREDGFPAVRKRLGFERSASGLEAPFHNLTSIPLPDPDDQVDLTGIVVFHDSGGASTANATTNGTSWTSLTIDQCYAVASPVWPLFNGAVYYPSDTTPRQIVRFDGTTASVFYTFPVTEVLADGFTWSFSSIVKMAADETYLYVATAYNRIGNAVVLVHAFDASATRTTLSGGFVSLGSYPGGISEYLEGMVTWRGELWVASRFLSGFNTGVTTRRMTPPSGSWTVDDSVGGTLTTSYTVDALVAGGTRLALSLGDYYGGVNTLPILRTRTASSGWVTVLTGANVADRYWPLAVTGSRGLVAYRDDPAGLEHVLRTTNWSSFSTIATRSAPVYNRWLAAPTLGSAVYAARDDGGGGAGYAVERIQNTTVTTVLTTTYALRGIGGWQ